MIVEITGGTATFRDRPNVRAKKILRAASADLREVLSRKYDGDLTKIAEAPPNSIKSDGELMDVLDDFGCKALCVLLESWTLRKAMPQTVPEWWDFDEPDIYDELIRAVTPIAYAAIGSGSLIVTPENARDPETPTEPSSDSNGGGRAPKTSLTTLPTG